MNKQGNGTGYGVPTIGEALQDQDELQPGIVNQMGVDPSQKGAARGDGGSPSNWNGDGDSAEDVDAEMEDAFATFYQGYVSCLLWTEGVDIGNSSDLSPSLRQESRTDCRNFFDECAELFGANYEQAGHDFWLSRNGHGAGFFDGDYAGNERLLQKAARLYGSVSAYYDEENGLVCI